MLQVSVKDYNIFVYFLNSQIMDALKQTISKAEENKINAEKEMKQHYLREQIIDKNYDPQEFAALLNQELGINSNLEKCQMKDLQEVVALFHKLKSENNSSFINSQRSQQFQEENDTMICESITLVQELQPKLIVIRDNPKIKEEQFQNEIKCVKVYLKIDPKKQHINCEVNQPQRIHSSGVMGIGATSYLCFKIYSSGLVTGFVRRRYSDFIWLRNMLLKFHPTQIIPPIPNKKASKRLPRQILKRMRILTMFLNDLVKNPILVNSKYVEGFLTIKDEKAFQKLKEQAENRKAFQSMLSTETISGYVSQQLSEKTIKYKDGISKFTAEAQTIYKQITRKCKTIKRLNQQKITSIYEIGNNFVDLHSISNRFNEFVKTQGMTKLTQIYAALNNMMADWGNSLQKQVDEIDKNLCTFFKYIRQEFVGIKQLLLREEKVQQDFIKQKEALDKQKQKIYQLHDSSKWGISKSEVQFIPKSAIYDRTQAFKIMMPKQSVRVNELKQQMAYYLSQIYIKGNEYCVADADKFCDNFKQFVIKTKVNNQQIGAMWAEMAQKFSNPYKKIQQVKKMKTVYQSLEISEMNQSSIFQ